MTQQRWLRIIPVALVMYTISYVDRTNVSLALDPNISSMMRDLLMDDRMKGQAAGIFFFGYVMLQIPGGYWATHWSARKLVSWLLVAWGTCAAGCGLSHSFRQFELMRFLLGVAESGVFPATLVLLAHWFPRAERAQATAYWSLCQPMAVVLSAPVTGWLLGAYGWQRMLILEGALPFLWLPLWWGCVRDHPKEASWIGPEERQYLETTLAREKAEIRSEPAGSLLTSGKLKWLAVLIVVYFLQNCEAYGCMTFFTSGLKQRGFSALQYGILFALPYALAAVLMIIVSRHSDKTQERRWHVAVAYAVSGGSLLLAVLCRQHFWLAYGFMCLAIPGPFVGMGPFWSIPAETLPRNLMGSVMGLVNACGNLGGFAGPYIAGWLKKESGDIAISFDVLGIALLVGAGATLLLPKPADSADHLLHESPGP